MKENGRESDLESGTLRTIILEKIPERLVPQYYRWIKENNYNDSLEKLKDWVAQEAEYQIQALEVKHGISADGDKKRESPRKYRSFFSKEGGRKNHDPCFVCAGSHPIANRFEVKLLMKNGELQNKLHCVTGISAKII